MLVLSETILDVPILSLQTGTEIARTTMPIIDRSKLTIIACYVEGERLDTDPCVLFMSDIRESSDIGFIVDDSSALMGLDNLVRLQSVIDEGIMLIDADVYDKSGTKIGKVTDYSYEPSSFLVQQLFVKPPFIQSIVHDTRIIHRTQILSVSKERITVDSTEVTASQSKAKRRNRTIANPFLTPETETQ